MLNNSLRLRHGKNIGKYSAALVLGLGVAACSQAMDSVETTRTDSEPVSDGGITPFIIDPSGPGGNVTCEALGYEFSSARVNYENGEFDADFPSGIDVETDGTFVAWTSTFPIGAVIVKGSDDANVYEYGPTPLDDCEPSEFCDSGLASPINASGSPAGLSNLTFCWDALVGMLEVNKTANATYTRTHDWSIDKSVHPDELYLYIDGSGDSKVKWTVDVVYEGPEDADFKVSGVVTIANTGGVAATIESIVDGELNITECILLGQNDEPDTPFDIEEYTLDPGDTLECDYSIYLDENENEVEFDKKLYNEVVVKGVFADYVPFEYDATDDYKFDSDKPTTEINKSVKVVDNNDGFADAHADEDGKVILTAPYGDTFTYEEKFKYADREECGTFTVKNRAKVIGDGKEVLDKAKATLTIYVQCFVFADDTAWAANGHEPGELMYTLRGNWATYVKYEAGKTTTLFAGQTNDVGTVHFSAASNDMITITVTLTSSAQFEEVAENLKVQDYSSAPSGNPNPGGFDHKKTCDAEENICEITVPLNHYYGVHADVGEWIPDPDFGPEL